MVEKEKIQDVPEGWEAKELFTVAKVLISNVDKKSHYNNEMLVKLCNYMDVYKNERITSNLDFMIATATKREIEKFKLNKDDVIITKDSETPDDIAVASVVADEFKNVLCGYHLALLRPQKAEVHGQYLTLALKTNLSKRYFGNQATGVTRFGLALSAIKQAKIFVPPLREQRTIASILSTCDEAIEKTDAKIEKLKRIKQGLMQDLFRFGIDENGKMRSEATHRFKDSPLGRIPEEWEVDSLKNLIKGPIRNGYFKKPELVGSGYRLINVLDLYQDFGINTDYLERVHATQKDFINNEVSVGDCFFTRSSLVLEGIAQCNILRKLHEPTIFECHVMRVKPNKNRILPEYFAHFCRGNYARKYFMSMAKQVTMTTIDQGGLYGLLILIPRIPEQKLFIEHIDAINEAIEKEEAYKNKLLAIKRGLMDDLLSGKVRVNKLIREAA